jgi:hypothetical protein
MRCRTSLTVALLFTLPVAAADPLADTVKEAVTARQVHDSDLKGSGAALTPYREVASDGAVLVGLEVGVGGTAPAERVAAVRPIYRLAGKNRTGMPAGRFLSDEVTRTVRLVARDGFAVGGIRISAGRRIDGLALQFLRVDESKLDTADAYESEWVGNAKDDGRELVAGQGRPVVGVFGRLEGDALLGIGLTFADVPVPTPAPAAPTVGTLNNTPSDSPPSAAKASSNTVLGLIVFAIVAVPVALIGVWTLKRRSGGVQQLPRVVRSAADIDLRLTRPPSIPTDLLMPSSAPPRPKSPVDQMIALETDAFRH